MGGLVTAEAYYINKNDWPTQATNEEPQHWALYYFFQKLCFTREASHAW